MSRVRYDFEVINGWIRPGSRVLDLGCGDGDLLRQLGESQQVTGYGIEIDDRSITACIKAGVNVIQSDLDLGLSAFDDDSFDYVILSMTLQASQYPHRLLSEMLRVGTEGIVTFPNFGHISARRQLAIGGRMPVTKTLPLEWYNTSKKSANGYFVCGIQHRRHIAAPLTGLHGQFEAGVALIVDFCERQLREVGYPAF